jgi:hypothetical protein
VLPAVTATRYVTPLREGGSLPGLMEADDLGTYVVKWRAAGQGVRVLVAEVVCGELARALSLPVPALVTVDVAAELAVGEPDFEVQELMQRSAGRNLGLDYLPGALDFEAGAGTVGPDLAGRVLWFDALVGNVDRSWRNPNMLFGYGFALTCMILSNTLLTCVLPLDSSHCYRPVLNVLRTICGPERCHLAS